MTLALLGGKPVRSNPYPPYLTIEQDDIERAIEVLKTGILSDYEGSNNEWFMGGKYVKEAEARWASYFKVKHAIAMNSATSCLYAAVGAAGVGPGDEVITTPWTMTATATAVVVNNAVPVFADIDMDTFCISPEDIEKKISKRTKAIMPVHIYGHPAAMNEIKEIANTHNLTVIEDAAQALGAEYNGEFTGTIGDMGVYSLNCHKQIQTGEGGVVVTNDDELALRLQMIRNHAEAVVATGLEPSSLFNMVGWNYRMNEIEAAISIAQLNKMERMQKNRDALAHYLTENLSRFKGIITPSIKAGCSHVYYRYAVRINPAEIPVTARTIVEALNAEGLDWYSGYMPLNMFPIYQKQIAFGDKGCPFKCPLYDGSPDYSLKSLPTVRHHMEWSLSTEHVRPPLKTEDMDMMVMGFEKVLNNMDELFAYEAESKEQLNDSN